MKLSIKLLLGAHTYMQLAGVELEGIMGERGKIIGGDCALSKP